AALSPSDSLARRIAYALSTCVLGRVLFVVDSVVMVDFGNVVACVPLSDVKLRKPGRAGESRFMEGDSVRPISLSSPVGIVVGQDHGRVQVCFTQAHSVSFLDSDLEACGSVDRMWKEWKRKKYKSKQSDRQFFCEGQSVYYSGSQTKDIHIIHAVLSDSRLLIGNKEGSFLMVEKSEVQTINERAESTHKSYDIFTIDQFKSSLMGSIPQFRSSLPLMQVVEESIIPTSFDSRETWPGCKTIQMIRNQGWCGSCWAHAASESFGDRYCIASEQTQLTTEDDLLSPQWLCSCDKLDHGCLGGNPLLTGSFLNISGIVKESCFPYVSGDGVSTPECISKCIDGSKMERFLSNGTAVVSGSTTDIMKEINANGPVEAVFQVYTDFPLYSSGVYQHVSGSYEGGHAVKIIGWGTTNDTDYWIVSNSWGYDWGENGTFRIIRGVDECGIESMGVVGFLPRV
ncbi:hypothetical protein ADUPG1_008761, partial [Aduncisulcus paluster]